MAIVKTGKNSSIFEYGELKDFLSGEGDILTKRIAKYASEGVGPFRQIQLDPYRFIYVRNRAISADEYYGPNDNGDGFPEVELRKGYPTFIGKPVTTDHQGFIRIGVVLDSQYVEPVDPLNPLTGHFVMNIWAIDKKAAASYNSRLPDYILEGKVIDTSMGVAVEYSQCSICGHIAHVEDEYCYHIRHQKLATIAIGSGRFAKVYERCYGLNFFEDSLIIPLELGGRAGGRGADRMAEIKEIFTIPTPVYRMSSTGKSAADYKTTIDSFAFTQRNDDVKGPDQLAGKTTTSQPNYSGEIRPEESEEKEYDLPNESFDSVKHRFHAIEDLGEQMSSLRVDEIPNVFSELSVEEQSDLQQNILQLIGSVGKFIAQRGLGRGPGMGEGSGKNKVLFDNLVDMVLKRGIPFGIAIQSIYDSYISDGKFVPVNKPEDFDKDGFHYVDLSEENYADIFSEDFIPLPDREDFDLKELDEDLE